jgi:hypothetical protein
MSQAGEDNVCVCVYIYIVIRKISCPCAPPKWAPRHEGELREWRYSSTHSLTSALDGGERSASRPEWNANDTWCSQAVTHPNTNHAHVIVIRITTKILLDRSAETTEVQSTAKYNSSGKLALLLQLIKMNTEVEGYTKVSKTFQGNFNTSPDRIIRL